MKKVMIVLLAALLLVSFSSCKKDKSEDVIATYESFCKVQEIVDDVPRIFSNMDVHNNEPVEKSNSDISIDSDLTYLLSDIDSKYEKIYTLKDLSATGTVKRELSEEGTTSTETWTVTNCEVSFKYDLKDNLEAFIDDKITINGTFVVKTLGTTRGDYEAEEVDASFSLNGTNYSISYATNTKPSFTRAKVNGNDVDLRLLNSNN